MEVYSVEEMVLEIKKIKRRSRFSPHFDNSDILRIDNQNRGNFNNRYFRHRSYDFRNQNDPFGLKVHAKIPKQVGQIHLARRVIGEAWYGTRAIRYDNLENMLEREKSVLNYLQQVGFPSLIPVYDLLKEKSELPIEKGICLTKEVEDAFVISNQLEDEKDKDTKIEFCQLVTKQMKRLHDIGIVWGNARLDNAMFDPSKEELYLHGFGTTINQKLTETELFTYDIEMLCHSAIKETRLDPKVLIPKMLRTYGPSEKFSDKATSITSRRLIFQNSPRITGSTMEELYLRPVIGIDFDTYMNTQEAINDYFAKKTEIKVLRDFRESIKIKKKRNNSI